MRVCGVFFFVIYGGQDSHISSFFLFVSFRRCFPLLFLCFSSVCNSMDMPVAGVSTGLKPGRGGTQAASILHMTEAADNATTSFKATVPAFAQDYKGAFAQARGQQNWGERI